MAEGLFIGVIGGLIVAAILGLINWLRKEGNRTRVRQTLCRHDWFSPMDEFNEPGSAIVFLTPVSEECRKCGKTR